MDKKNYVWIGIGILAVIIAVLLIIKTTSQTEVVTKDNNLGEAVTNNVAPEVSTEIATAPLSEEAAIVADGKTFTPKTINTKLGQKVFISFTATDEIVHNFGFIDQQLSFIKMPFSKAEGKKSVTFPAPGAGTFTYYVDDQTNTGKLIITE